MLVAVPLKGIALVLELVAPLLQVITFALQFLSTLLKRVAFVLQRVPLLLHLISGVLFLLDVCLRASSFAFASGNPFFSNSDFGVHPTFWGVGLKTRFSHVV